MTWTINNVEFTSEMIGDHIGFIYQITNLSNNRKYIGKKIFKFKKYKTVKGKRKSVHLESDWKNYFGSNDELKTDVKLLGEDNFKREILRLCDSKSELSYFESKTIFLFGCLESDEWYNSWISTRINKRNLTKVDWKNEI